MWWQTDWPHQGRSGVTTSQCTTVERKPIYYIVVLSCLFPLCMVYIYHSCMCQVRQLKILMVNCTCNDCVHTMYIYLQLQQSVDGGGLQQV